MTLENKIELFLVLVYAGWFIHWGYRMIKDSLNKVVEDKSISKFYSVPEYIIFNVDNFNAWFNAKDNNAEYANPGIFLRLDKLSESHIKDYIEKCYGIENGAFLWSKPVNQMVSDFYRNIREDWKNKL